MLLSSSKAIAWWGFFIPPVVVPQSNTFGAKAPDFTLAQRESPCVLLLNSTLKSSVRPGAFLFCRRGSKEGVTTMHTEKTLHRFFSKVQKTESCWLWTRYKTQDGYGLLRAETKLHYAHRFSYEIHHGPIPSDLHVLHKCDNPACVNPAHLFLGTHSDNMADMVSKGRKKGKRGGSNTSAKLTRVQVLEIRARYPQGGTSYRKLAKEYGVTNGAIENVVNRKTWKDA